MCNTCACLLPRLNQLNKILKRDEKPLAATAVVVTFVLGVSALVQVISGPHEPIPAEIYPMTVGAGGGVG
jgi:hypothetical protein